MDETNPRSSVSKELGKAFALAVVIAAAILLLFYFVLFVVIGD